MQSGWNQTQTLGGTSVVGCRFCSEIVMHILPDTDVLYTVVCNLIELQFLR
jgi:hypothetical protein